MTNKCTFILLLLGVSLCNSLRRQNLGGQWVAVGQDAEITVNNATVPGGVFSDLMNNGIIEDIFYGNRDSEYRWVGLTEWIYSTQFTGTFVQLELEFYEGPTTSSPFLASNKQTQTNPQYETTCNDIDSICLVDEDFLSNSFVNIVFEGLDTFATVSINGVEVGQSGNMFLKYVFDVKQHLEVGTNDLSVRFSSPVKMAETLANSASYVIPPECPAQEYNGICHANQIRKMQASFSWDWGPAFASVGIWKDVYLEGFGSAIIDYVVATPVRNADDSWDLTITTYFNAGNANHATGTLQVNLTTEDTSLSVQQDVDAYANEYNEIISSFVVSVPVSSVKMWWPNGYGDQILYDLSVNFKSSAGDEDSKTKKVGFRTVELVQEQLASGLSFYFKVNGYPIFAKGANEIPISILPEKGQDKDTVRRILQSVKDANMNMLRVWGGGVYESDYFYQLTDEFGILIWQDFMFACAMYPANSDFTSIVRLEVSHQLKRLGSHTSIAVWAGNNENESALSQNWYNTNNNFDTYKKDYLELYVNVIQTEVLRVLPKATFITSSPTNGRESDQEDHVAKNPSDPLFGDVHFYDYSSDSWSMSTFPVPRFASEYGYQSMPSIDSWLTATDDINNLNPYSSFMQSRQHHPDGNQQNINLINLQLQLPDSSSNNYIPAFVYFSQIVQAQSIKVETEHYRSFKGRLNDQQQGNTMGALYWQLNDVWVAPTWSGMDFTGKWKMLQYYTLDFFKPIIITGNLNQNNQLEVYAIFDGLEVPENITVMAMVHIYKWDSLEPLAATQYPVTLDPQKAVLVTTIDAPTALTAVGCGSDYQAAKTTCFFHLHLMDQNMNNIAPQNYVFPEKLKNCNLPQPNLQVESITVVNEESTMFEINLTTDVNTLFVWLDSHEIRGRFSENGFLQVYPKKTVTFTADEPTTVDELSKVLTVTNLKDSAYL